MGGAGGIVATLAVLGALALLLAWSRWLADRRGASLGHLALGSAALAGALWLWPLATDVAEYPRVLPGQPVAEVYFQRSGSNSFRALLTHLPGGRMQAFDVHGEQWRLEARTLTWRGTAAQLGLKDRYRLERFAGRYASPRDAATPPPSDYALASTVGADLWARVRTGDRWQRSAAAGQAFMPWRPMEDGARWEVRFVEAGLEATQVQERASRPAPAPSR